MLASIVQSLSSALGDVLEGFMTMFLEALNMNLSSFLEVFPLLSTFYTYLRSFAVAMTAIVAGRALASFWFGSIDNSAKDNPLMILLKTFFAVAGIYWGGYVLEYIVHLGSIPYNHFLNIEAVIDGKVYFKEFISGFFGFATASITSWSNLAKGLCELFLLIVIAWNLFKLVVEICERWLMVGVLVYTSPLVYCTIPSGDTSGIFKKWASMFVGSVIQMSLSVMFLKLILSGFNAGGSNFVIKLLMILAMSKIAQRMDSYLQQLGIGVATTGGNMVDDLIAGAHGLKSLTGRIGGGRREGASRGSILGSYAGRTNIGAGISAAASAFRNGAGAREAAKAGVNGAADNLIHKSPVGRAVSAAWAAQKANRSQSTGGNTVTKQQPGGKPVPVSAPPGADPKRTASYNSAGSPVGMSGTAVPPRTSKISDQASKNKTASSKQPGTPSTDSAKVGETGEHREQTQLSSPLHAAKSGFMSGAAYMLGLNNGEPVYSQDELRSSENNARANAAAAADEAQEYQSGGAVMPDDIKDDAKQIQEGKGVSHRMNYSENYREYGIKNNEGNVLELNGDDDIQPSIAAAASGVAINSNETADGDLSLIMTDRCGGRAVSDYMAQAVSTEGKASSGTGSFAVSMPSRQEYIDSGLDEESYRQKGQKAAEKAKTADSNRISSYEKSMPETKAARTAVQSAQASVDILKHAGAAPEQISAAEQEFEGAKQSLHDATVTAGERKVQDAKAKMERLEQLGFDHRSKELGEAESEYEQQKENLAGYQEAYERANTPESYENIKESAAAAARSADMDKLSSSYDSIRDQARSLLDETIRTADVFAKARALNNPNYIPADIPQTRQMAYDVFKDAIQDMKPGTGFNRVQVFDLPTNSNNPGNYENQGGREIEVSYMKADGSTGIRRFLNGKGTSALPISVSSQYSVYKSADGRQWLTDDPDGKNRNAPVSGRQVREPSLITNIFTSIRKKSRKR